MLGGGTNERTNASPVVVGRGAWPGRIKIYLGLTSDGLLQDQHSWQAEMGATSRRDATGLSRQTATISADTPFSEREGMPGGRKMRVSCGPYQPLNPSKQDAKGGGVTSLDLICRCS